MPLRRSCFRVLLAAALPLLASCTGASTRNAGSDGGSAASNVADSNSPHPFDEFPRGHAAVVTIENARYDPPRTLGLVSANHPGVQGADAELRRSGFKRVEVDDMDKLLERLDDLGFLDASTRATSVHPLDPRTQLSRITVTVDNAILELIIPRRPTKEAADRFTALARSITELFNAILDLRPSRGEAGSELFFDVQRRLFESNREKLAAPPPRGGAR